MYCLLLYLRVEVEVVLVERAGDLEDALPAADDALGQDQRPLVGAHVLGSVPFLEKKKNRVYTAGGWVSG